MTDLIPPTLPAGGAAQKNALIRQDIVARLARSGACTLADLAAGLHVSIPTATKLVAELVGQGIVEDRGKIETAGGRRPNIFGLRGRAAFFVGAVVRSDGLWLAAIDLNGEVVAERAEHDFVLSDDEATLEDLCHRIETFAEATGLERSEWLGTGLCLEGYVDGVTGTGHTLFASFGAGLHERIGQRLGVRTWLEGEVRARCYADYWLTAEREPDLLFLCLDRSVSVGMMVGGRLYNGRSGYAGAFGHIPLFDNGAICVCGRKGCLETEVAGWAIERKLDDALACGVNSLLQERHAAGQRLGVDDIVAAAQAGDSLATDLIGQAGEKIGRSVALLLNLLNPASVVVGGALAAAGDYLMLPLLAAANRHALNPIYRETTFRLSQLGTEAGPRGAALLIRNRIIGIE